jgi:FAD:protein FMN transferase
LPPASNSARRARPLLGTFAEIAVADAAPSEMHAAIDAAFDAVAKVHALMSFHDANSDVGRLNSEAFARPLEVHRWTFKVLEAAMDLHRRSAGLFDIAIAPILQNMGLLPRPPAHRAANSGDKATSAAIELLSDHRVRFHHRGIRIDLGGIAKGFAVDRAIEVLRDFGISRGVVNAGGDLAAFGPHSETVYIRDSRDPRRLICGIEIENQALASSGGYFDPFRSACPLGLTIIDPRTHKPASMINAATVRAPSCLIADALTKVVMIAGSAAAALLEQYQASALVVLPSGDVEMTQDLRSAVCLAA